MDKNLYGKYGIFISLEKAIFTELEEMEYKNKLRTAIIVYNGNDGNRSAPDKFEKYKNDIEAKAIVKGVLSRRIERWDLSHFSKLIYPYKNYLRAKEYFNNSITLMSESIKIIDSLKKNFPAFGINEDCPNSTLEEYLIELNKIIIHLEDKYGPIQIIKNK